MPRPQFLGSGLFQGLDLEGGGTRAATLLGVLLAAFLAGLMITLLLYRYLAQKWFPDPAPARLAT